MSSQTPSRFSYRLRGLVPLVGAVAVFAWFLATTDLAAVAAAFHQADVPTFLAVQAALAAAVWIFDSWCLTWLVGTVLPSPAGRPRLRDFAPLKAASYVLNIINYNAALVGMAFVISRRRGVGIVQSTAALAVLNYIDIVALSALIAIGLTLDPSALTGQADLLTWIGRALPVVLVGAIASLVLLQSGWRHPLLDRVRALAILRPLALLRPGRMLVGVVLRTLFVTSYVACNYLLLLPFGASPDFARLMVLCPVLTFVGILPISISGIGTTQVIMRGLYAPFVADGRDPGPVIDAWSTAFIFGFILIRTLIALPFLGRVWRELLSRPEPGE